MNGITRLTTLTTLLALTVVLAASGAALAGKLDLSGDWTYSTAGSWKKGPCPVGSEAKGAIKITQQGDKVTLVITAGRVCNPASMCTFVGTLKGNKLTVSNAAKVDTEGGKVQNSIALEVKDTRSAAGTSSSSYKHPGGMTCTWGSKVSLTRK